MMKLLKRLLLFISLFFIYVIIKEFLVLYHYTRSLHPILGYATLFVIGAFLFYFVLFPVFRIISMPRYYAPTRDPQKIPWLVETRIKNFRNNPHLLRTGFDFEPITIDRNGYRGITEYLQPELERIRKKYVIQVFYGTSIAQNGFLDALIILSASINMVRDMFILYHGRVSNKDLMSIAKMVYYSMAIGGSESIEYAVDELVSKVFTSGIKGLPFASKILGSIADGFINAALVTRLSLITENYCKMIFIESEKALYPSYKTVISTTKIITSDLIERVLKEVKNLAKDKTGQMIWTTVNPMRYVIARVTKKSNKETENFPVVRHEYLDETSLIDEDPVGFSLRKLKSIFRKPSH